MMIWAALVIPLIGVWVLAYWWPHRTVWWEYVLPLAVCVLLIATTKGCTEHQQVQSTEYWGSTATEARYYEDWNEYIHRRCTRSYPCGKSTCTTTYDCSYVRNHSAYWEVRTNQGEQIRIPEARYKALRQRWANEQFKELRRNYHTDDGDMYLSSWPGDSARLEPVTTVHTYENRVKAADASIFHFQPVTPSVADSLGLYEYPPIEGPYTQQAVLGDSSAQGIAANAVMKYWNAVLGPSKEVKVFVLVFRNKPRHFGQLQEWYWKGGNMNELVVCIGLDNSNTVQWCHPISWGTDHLLQALIRQHVETQGKLLLLPFSRWLGPVVREHFVRRDFKEFDYLSVEPPTWAVVMTYVLVVFATVFCCAFAASNEADPVGRGGKGHSRGYWH